MGSPVKSFNVDHVNMVEGLYVVGNNDGIITYDLRMFKPNTGVFIDPKASHTIEHFMATYLRQIYGDNIVYVGPMGCLTGFYVLVKESITEGQLITGLIGLYRYMNSTDEIPGANEYSCGNYKYNDLDKAREVYNEYYNKVLVNYDIKLCDKILNEGITRGGTL